MLSGPPTREHLDDPIANNGPMETSNASRPSFAAVVVHLSWHKTIAVTLLPAPLAQGLFSFLGQKALWVDPPIDSFALMIFQ